MQPNESQILFPQYAVRRSKRARRIGLRVQPGRGLEIVLPLHADAACIPNLLAEHAAWIEKTLARTAVRQSGRLCTFFAIKGGTEYIYLHLTGLGSRPGSLACAGCLIFPSQKQDSQGHDLYGRDSGSRQNNLNGRTITLAGMCAEQKTPLDCLEVAKKRLRALVKAEAKVYLENMLDELAALCKVSYNKLTIRFQRTRWGSCSSRGHINLNAALLFLPKDLARYIVIHELCHLQHMNHSENYWQKVFAVEPNAIAYDKAMRSAWQYVPAWALR